MKHQQLISETAVKTKAVIQTLQREIRCIDEKEVLGKECVWCISTSNLGQLMAIFMSENKCSVNYIVKKACYYLKQA